VKWIMERSLTKTLAHKLRISVKQVYRRFQTTTETDRGPRKVLRVEVKRCAREVGRSVAGSTVVICAPAPSMEP
jgi:hypothetical protein